MTEHTARSSHAARETTLARHLGARVFGPAQPWLLHLRPAEWPILLAHTTVGWLLARGLHPPTAKVWLGIGAWVVCLNGGTLALNSAFDRDDGDMTFLDDPPSPPTGLAIGAVFLMLLGFALTWRLPGGYRAIYVLCAVMSVAYSVPPLRLKAMSGADWLFVALGFGTFSPAAAWAIAGRPFGGPKALVLWAFCPLLAGLFPLTQLHRRDQHRSGREDNLVFRIGVNRSLEVALACLGFAFGMLAMAGWQSGWRTHADLVRWAALVLAGGAWIAVLWPWYAAGAGWSAAQHRQAASYALVAWLLTDAAVLLGWAI